ncbi:MAG: glycosyltransferase family 39 protein [Candidatus Omnitrophica bacterium]|nr:glycosyltransferase family 39 protein [Candidatus Omnitrophota bacterium]
MIYPFFKVFSYDKWALAIPHIVSTIIGFYILYLICRRYFRTIYGYIITFTLVCFNVTLIKHATEIRPYAVLPTLALASLYLSLQLVEHHASMTKAKKWLIGTFFILVLWFHVYGILILFCPLVFALLTKFGDASFKIILKSVAKIIAVVLGVTLLIWFLSLFGPHLPWQGHGFRVNQYIPYPFEDFIGFLKGVFGNLVGQKKLYFLLLGMAIPFFLPSRERFQQITFLFITIFIPIGLIFLADAVDGYFFVQRQFIWVMPFFAFYLGWSWESLIMYVRRR